MIIKGDAISVLNVLAYCLCNRQVKAALFCCLQEVGEFTELDVDIVALTVGNALRGAVKIDTVTPLVANRLLDNLSSQAITSSRVTCKSGETSNKPLGRCFKPARSVMLPGVLSVYLSATSSSIASKSHRLRASQYR